MRAELNFAANGVILNVFRPQEGKNEATAEVLVFTSKMDLIDKISGLVDENNAESVD